MHQPQTTVLIVDASPEDRRICRQYLADVYHLCEAEGGAHALELCQTFQPACIILGYHLADANGLEVLCRIRAQHGALAPAIIFLIGAGYEALAVEATQQGAQDYLLKAQFTAEALRRAVRHAVATTVLQRTSEARFRALAEALPAIVWTAAPDGTITFANAQWFHYCGLTPEENAQGWPELVLHPDDRERCLAQWNDALARCTSYEIEVRNRRHDGVYRWFLTRAVPVHDTERRGYSHGGRLTHTGYGHRDVCRTAAADF